MGELSPELIAELQRQNVAIHQQDGEGGKAIEAAKAANAAEDEARKLRETDFNLKQADTAVKSVPFEAEMKVKEQEQIQELRDKIAAGIPDSIDQSIENKYLGDKIFETSPFTADGPQNSYVEHNVQAAPIDDIVTRFEAPAQNENTPWENADSGFTDQELADELNTTAKEALNNFDPETSPWDTRSASKTNVSQEELPTETLADKTGDAGKGANLDTLIKR